MKKCYLIIFFISLWSALVLIAMPAIWAIYLLQKALPNWQVADVNGSFWRGSAQQNQLLIDGKPLLLGELKWRLHPLGLLWLKPCVSFSTDLQNQTLSANVCLSLISRELQFYDSQFSINAAALEPWLSVRLGGSANARLKLMVIKDRYWIDVDGIIQWRQAQFHNSQTWVDLGDLQARLSNDGAGGLQSQLMDMKSGPLIANLTIKISKSGDLSVSGKVAPRAASESSAGEALHQTLQIIGDSDNRGGYIIDWSNR